ncbi:daunorubicin resistance ABC transporter membrane protein [Archaeoglobus sulfaticallidus PM70-1]|uniref:Daunorubicin resistance ABC transporter membrane protein n=1 Tax=Archaeoglobus sulfaticallidus PM70-1 TaxID=387631 RepID=N0BNI1_9EURY|nr:ABC transporter permease [Archaeoglobus sulfaticallidus]AGK61875.1 daunorubicin resistance ABC transporter membrane protein [Archaeoglobus sulfaticallidus PM70-1]
MTIGMEVKIRKELNGVYTLWLRDLKRYVRARSRIIGSLGMPVFFLAFLGMGFRRANIPSLEGMNYIDFLAPGIIAMVILFTGTFSGVSIVWDRQFGFLREIMVSPISRTAISIGRNFGGATTAIIQGLMMFALSLLIGFRPNIYGIALALVFMFLIAVSFTGLGIIISTLMEDIHGFQLVINFFVFPVFFLSGALYPLDELPAYVRLVSYFDPLTYGVDGLRYSLTGFNEFNPALDLIVLIAFSIFAILFSAIRFSRTEVE